MCPRELHLWKTDGSTKHMNMILHSCVIYVDSVQASKEAFIQVLCCHNFTLVDFLATWF